MKAAQPFIIFLIFSIVLNPFASAITVDTDVFTPTDFSTMQTVDASPVVLESKILVAGETSTMSTTLVDGKISISDSVHTFREVSMDYQMLIDELEGFNGKQIALTHINDAGDIDSRRVVSVSPDVSGYVSVIMEFSTTIVDGFTGTTTTTLTGLSGNQSISVPDGSSYDLNITNNQLGVWTINGTDYTKRILWTLNTTTENLTDFQVGRVTPYDSDMQVDMDDRQLTYYENNTLISFWDKSVINSTNATSYVKVPKTSTTEQQRFWMYYGNSSASSASSIDDTVEGGDDFPGSSIDTGKWDGYTAGASVSSGIMTFTSDGSNTNYLTSITQHGEDLVLESNMKFSTTPLVNIFGMYNPGGTHLAQGYMDSGPLNRFYSKDGTTNTYVGTNWVKDTWGIFKIKIEGGVQSDLYWDGVARTNSPKTTNPANASDLEIRIGTKENADLMQFDWIIIRKYTATEPIWLADGSEQNSTSGKLNITASVTGDNNTQEYNTSQSREFTLTPTGETNNVNINTTSKNYDVTITTYWTEDTVQISEIVSNGYANITVQYTPSNNITAGVINATYNLIDFAAHDYTGNLSVLVDDADYSSNGTRLLNDVNTTIVDFDTSTHYINFSVPYNPPLDLYSPNDTATLSYAYPPLTHDVVLSWGQSTGTYKYTVTDYDTGAIISSSTVSSNTTTVALASGQYKWYINGYDDVFDEYGPSSLIRSFTVADTFSYPNDTVVHGVVYEYILGVQTPLDTALVNIWNNTWSGSSMTGTNGYFVFQGLHNSTYSMKATKDGYIDSNIELVTPVFNTTLTRDILLQSSSGAGQLYVDHYVKFTVKSLLGTLYEGVEVNVYLGDAVITQYTATTGNDGAVGFELNENQQYRITFIDASQEISKTITLYPVNNDYTIYVFTWSYIPDDTPLQTIDYGITSASINLTAGYINASFNDTASTFTHSNFTIKAENGTVLYSFTTTDSTKDWSQVVTYNNTTTYIAVLEVFDTALSDGKIIQTAVISFKYGVRDGFDFGWSEQWQYQLFGALLILFIGGLFSAANAHFGAVVVVGIAWFNTYAGWFPATITSGLMLVLGTFLAIIFVMRKQESRI